MLLEYSSSGKWLELLKQVAPRVKRVAVLGSRQSCRDRSVRRHPGAAPSLGVEVSPVSMRDAGKIERASRLSTPHQWRLGLDRKRVRIASSRSHHIPCSEV